MPSPPSALAGLPLPLAQTLRRALNAKSPEGEHLAAYYFFESSLKLAAAAAVGVYRHLAIADPAVDRLLGELEKPSAGHWLGLLRETTRALAARPDAAVQPLPGVAERLARREPRPAISAFLQFAAKLEDKSDGRTSLSALDLYERVVAYRNRELGHGAQRSTAVYADGARLLREAAVEAWQAFRPLADLALVVSRDYVDPRTQKTERRHEVLRGDGVHEGFDGAVVDPGPAGRLVLVAPGVSIALFPFLVYTVDTLDRDRVGFLNSVATVTKNDVLAVRRVEYVDYDSGGRIDAPDATDELARLLGQLRGKPVGVASPDEAAAAPAEAGAGVRIGDCEIVAELGRGGMAIVYLAREASLGRLVALKVLPPALAADPVAVARFKQEIRALAICDHPNVVKVLAAGESGGHTYFTMEYVEGADLSEIYDELRAIDRAQLESAHLLRAVSTIAGSKTKSAGASLATFGLPEVKPHAPPAPVVAAGKNYFVQLATIIAGVARGLHYLHERGIVHRDIKPANLMLTTAGNRAVVMDLGLVQLASSQGQLTKSNVKVLGTLRYMPPEQLQRTMLQVTHLADVYALGASLYELAALRPMHDGETEAQLVKQVLQDNPPRPTKVNPRIPGDLEAIITTATAKLPSERYASASDLADDLEAFARGEPIRARPSAFYHLRLFYRRNRTLVRLVAAGLAVIVGLTAWFVIRLAHAHAVSTARLEEIQRLSDIKRLATAEDTARQLWPARADKIPAMTTWLAGAHALADQLPTHRATLAALRASGATDDATTWEIQTLDKLVADLARFTDRDRFVGTIASVEARLETARTLRDQTVVRYADAWTAAIARVAGTKLALAPQVGLVPLGADPQSGLEEFADLETGAAPVRGPDRKLAIGDATGLVFVLLPGGSFEMGASRDPSAANVDPESEPDEAPVREVALAPYLISKFEMTQAQWKRVTGKNPSHWQAGKPGLDGRAITLVDPVEQVSWDDTTEVTQQLALRLPTEAQWEYAARAGTRTVYWTGDDRQTLKGAVNLIDVYAKGHGLPQTWSFELWIDDGWVNHAPVGTFRANAFGLSEMTGNVWEWCRDRYGSYAVPPAPGDGERVPGGPDASTDRVIRGGSWSSNIGFIRSAARYHNAPDYRHDITGLRPVWPLQ